MSSQRFSLFFCFWLSVCCISSFVSALGGMDINSRDVDTGAVDLNPLESFSLDSCEILLSTGQITFEDGHTLPFQYSNAVLEDGCFSCYSTVPQKTVRRSTPLTIASSYYRGAEGTVQYVEIDTLVVVYPHYRNMSVRMDLSTADIEILKAEVAKSKRFLWRSSNLKCLMNTEADCIVIDRTLTPAQLRDVDGSSKYWLTYGSIDGATSVTQDLYNAGIVDGQYSVVIVFYAFENSEGANAAYAGAMHGVKAGFMGNTAYIAIPLAWGLERESVIIHEYIHALDSIFTQSGNPGGNDMCHADHLGACPSNN